MNIHFAPDHNARRVRIKVVGVGGAGGNAVNRMVEAGLGEVDFYAVNTDGQALDTSRAHQTLAIGNEITRGLGAGGDPDVGRRAAEEDREMIAGIVEDADMVFVTAGMGGGTGTGAAPVVAELARAGGALTVAVVTRPFLFEGVRRARQAEAGLDALRDQVDALLVIPNERLMEIETVSGGMTEVFRLADDVLYEATRGITEIISRHAVVNLDFADVRTVMQDSGAAIMGTGRAGGDDRASEAARAAINSPLLEEVDIDGSRAVLVYLAAGEVTREDLRGAMTLIQQAAGSDAHVFFGFANDDELGDDLQVTVIATGFPATTGQRREPTAADALASLMAAMPSREEPEAAAPQPAAVEAMPAAEPVVAPEPPDASEPVESEPVGDEPTERTADIEAGASVGTGMHAETEATVDTGATVEMGPDVPFERAAEAAPPMPATPHPAKAEPAARQFAERQTASTDHAELAAQAAAAGGAPREVGPASETSQRFLEPMGKVPLEPQQQAERAGATGQRFRSSVLSNDKTRPAWERKYVD
jgi:cell division protein FtsZ